MKQKTGRKLLGVLLTVALLLGLAPGLGMPATAEGTTAEGTTAYAAYLVTADSNNNKSSSELKAIQVTFNGYKWYIIEDNSTSRNSGTITLLLAEGVIGLSKYGYDEYDNSTVKSYLATFTEENGSFANVASAIVDTEAGKLYLLSWEKAMQLSENVRKLIIYDDREATGKNCEWWLRDSFDDGHAWYVEGMWGSINNLWNTSVDHFTKGAILGVRPVLTLDLSKVTSGEFSVPNNDYGRSVALSGGENATASGGKASQLVLGAITNVVYTAYEGYIFPETSDYYTTTNGIKVERTSDTTVKVSGTPTEDTTITVPDALAPISATVTFKVENGAWNNGTTEDKTVTLTGHEGYALRLTADQIPEVGAKPAPHYKAAGSWGEAIPNTEVAFEDESTTTYTYAYEKKEEKTITAEDVTVTYGDADKSVSASVIDNAAISYAVKPGSEAYIQVDASTGALTITKVPADGMAYVTVTAAETDNYLQQIKDVAVTVNKKVVAIPDIASGFYTGEKQTPTVTTSEHYSVALNMGGTAVGEYPVVLALKDPINYKWPDNDDPSKTLWFQITQADAPTVTVPTPEAVTYDPANTLANVTLPEGWAWVTGSTVPTVGNSGYDAALTVDDDNYDYTGVTGYDATTHKVTRTVALTVYKAAQELVMGPMAKTPTYTGSAQELVSAGSAPDGEMQYALGTETKATQPYTTSIPTATDIGTYYVWYRVVGDNNHEDTDALGPVEVNLDPEHAFGTPDFVLPAQLDVLDESAFEGVPSLKVVDAHSCTSIGRDVFKGTGLEQIRLPKDCEIDPEAFGEQRICVFAPAGGSTQAFCADHDNLVFIEE